MTHYEVLGVDPGAGVDEIRAAYRARARELHPDRRGPGAGPAGTSGGDGPQMAAVNQAWAVLGDPSRRAAYDAWLKGTSPQGQSAAASAAASTEAGATASAARPPSYDEDYPPPIYSAMPGCFASGALPWLLMVIILIVIFIFTAYATPGGDEDSPSDRPTSSETRGADPDDDSAPPLVAVRDIRGMCIRVAGGITSPVDCLTVPNEGRIVAQAAIGASCPPGTTEWLVRQLDTLACTQAATPGRP